MSDNLQVIVHEEEIKTRVQELAQEIETAYEGQDLTLIGLLEDSFMFLSDLLRAFQRPVRCGFMKATEQHEAGHKGIIYSTTTDLKDQNILLVGGILDTGVTLDFLFSHIQSLGTNSIRSVVLIDKPDFRKVEIKPDFVGFSRTEDMIVGYGLGFHDQYRQLSYLASLSDFTKE